MFRFPTDTLELRPRIVSAIYGLMLIVAAATYGLLHWIWGEYELLTITDILGSAVSLAGLGSVWFIFAFAIALVAFLRWRLGRPPIAGSKPAKLGRAIWLSLHAGIIEEVVYRWLVFFSAMIVLPFMNFITFGLTKWLYVNVIAPVTNWATFHALEPWLMNQSNWVLGAAIIAAASAFVDQHKGQGFIGWSISWVFGLAMFYLVLNYGLLTAIVAHVIYSAIFLVTKALASRQPTSSFDSLITQALRRM